MRLKALLIDDETNILKNLQIVLPWSDLEIDVIGLARNGVQAMEYVNEHHPEIILCDIRMPVMDGIQFLEQLRKVDLDAEVVMLTGYQDFEYARSVIKFGVRDYILKPINYDELTSVIERLSRSVREKRRERSSEEARLGKAMYLAYEKMLYDILMDYSSVSSQYMLYDDEVSPDQLRYILMLADFDDYSQKCRSSNEQERKLWNFAVRNVLQEALLSEGLRYAVLQMREGEWCVLVERETGENGVQQEDVRRWAAILQDTVLDNVKINLSIGIHPSEITLQELPKVFKSLQKTVHLATDKARSIIQSGRASIETENEDTLWEPIEKLVSALKQNDRDGVEGALQQLTVRIQAISGRSLARVEKLAHFIVLHLMREMRELDVLSAEQEQEIWTIMEQADRVKDMLAVVRRIVDVSLENSMGKKTGDVLMHSAKDYIGRNLARDLGIDELSDYLGISASYFSLLFKQHFGSTFVEYLTAERMELAKSLLLLTDKSVTEIGRSVGYTERRYFTKVFHKITGEIPSEYREKRKGGL